MYSKIRKYVIFYAKTYTIKFICIQKCVNMLYFTQNRFKEIYIYINMNNFKYSCNCCNFYTNRNNDYNKHIISKKHKNNSNENIECLFECKICNRKYKSNTGLWYHKKTCQVVKQETQELSNDNVKTLIEQNQQHQKEIEELKKLIIELTKKEQLAPITNNKLNINFFLNEQCKNAINMIDFVKSIVFELKDFENLLDKGFIENKTNIILENLNKLTVYERPLHYETQQEVIHIRDEDKWKKETDKDKPILENAIYYANEKEYMNFFEVYKKKTNGDIREDKDFEVVKKTLIKDDTDNSRNEIMENILEKVKI